MRPTVHTPWLPPLQLKNKAVKTRHSAEFSYQSPGDKLRSWTLGVLACIPYLSPSFFITDSLERTFRRPSFLQILLLPPSAQRSVELHDGDEFVSSDLRQPQFAVEQITVRIQSAQERIDSTLVTTV